MARELLKKELVNLMKDCSINDVVTPCGTTVLRPSHLCSSPNQVQLFEARSQVSSELTVA